MENEGIMGLPEGQAMQDQGSPNQPVYVSSADSYDAALTALGMSSNDPAQAEAVRRAIRESLDELDLSPMEISSLLEVLEHMSQNPAEYPQMRQRLIDAGAMDEDDLPEAYDPAYLGIAIMVLNELDAQTAQGAAAPMEMSPVVEGLEPLAMAEGGLADMARYLASKGRNGDSILAHITPSEARLLKSMGGSGTINPETGLPEFFLKKLFKGVKKAVKKALKNPIVRMIATVALATVLGPAAAAAAGKVGIAMSTAATAAAGATLSSAAVSAMAGEKLNAKNLLITAATSYFGAGGTVGGVNPVSKVAELAGRIPGVTPGGAVAQGIGAGVTSAGIGKLAGMGTEEALGFGLQSGIMTGVQARQAETDFAKSLGLKREDLYGGGTSSAITPSGTATQEQIDFARSLGLRPEELYGTATPAPQQATAAPTVAATGAPSAEATPVTPSPTTAAPSTTTTPARTPGMVSRVKDFLTGKEYYTLPDGTVSTEPVSLTSTFGVNPFVEPGKLARYAPGVATGLALTGALGGFKSKGVEEDPLFNRNYTGMDYIRDNPELFSGRIELPTPRAPSPVVPTPSYGLGTEGFEAPPTGQMPPIPTMPRTPVEPYMPPSGVATNMPGGVPQPYNAPGMYNIPLLYGNPARPARPGGYAQGGQVSSGLRKAVEDPRTVAQTEALLFSGPQAAQQAGRSVEILDRGIMQVPRLNRGGDPARFPRKTGAINGPGTGTSDSIPAMLSDGEFVFTAKAVRNAGQGSRRKGARRMYKLMKMLEGGEAKQG